MLGLIILLALILLSSVNFTVSTSAIQDSSDNGDDNPSNGGDSTTGNGTQSGEGDQPGNGTLSGNGTQTGMTVDKNKKTVDIESEKLMVKINAGGQVPIYQFWSPNANDTKFHVKFQKIQEFTDDNGNGFYENNETVGQRTLSLQSVRWILSDAIVGDEQISFNFTSESLQQSQFQGFQIKIVNYIDLENATKLKFDIYMSGWPFLSEDNMLSLRWDLTWTSENISYVTGIDGVYLKLDDETLAHFTYVSEVMIGGSSDTVTSSYKYNATDGAVQTFFNYPNFKDLELVHDPEIGLDGSYIIGGDTSSNPSDIVPILGDVFPRISKDGFIITTVVATFALIGLLGFRKRQL